jgi:hypothetical protein
LKILEKFVKKNPHATVSDIKELVPELAAVSEKHTNWLIVNKLKIWSRIAAQKPLLTEKMKVKRLAFAKKYVGWTEEDWSRIMFSDESMFRCIRASRIRVRRPSGTKRFDTQYTIKTVKHPDSVMVWASFSGSCGQSGIFFLPRK